MRPLFRWYTKRFIGSSSAPHPPLWGDWEKKTPSTCVLRNTHQPRPGSSSGNRSNLLAGAVVLGDSLGAFRHGVLGQFTREQQSDGSLNFSGRDGGSLVVRGQFGGFVSDTFKDVVHERVHDGHGLVGHTSVRVDLSK